MRGPRLVEGLRHRQKNGDLRNVQITKRGGNMRIRKQETPSTSTPTPSKESFRGDIQGLRAIAVSAVVLDHIDFKFAPGGFVGVDIFFVISGFLMTSFLWRRLQADRAVDLPDFYARRAKRLLPAAATVLAATAVATTIILPNSRWVDIGKDIVSSALYAENWRLAFTSIDYLNAAGPPSPVQHYWSLAVEEQFYLGWPIIFLLVAWLCKRRFTRSENNVLAVSIFLITILSFAWCLHYTSTTPDRAYFSTFTRIWELGLGGLVLTGLNAYQNKLPALTAAALSWIGLAGITVSIITFNHELSFPGYYALLPTLSTALILYCCGTDQRGSVAFILERRPLQTIGNYSYSLYLWHWPVIIFLKERFGDDANWLVGSALIASLMLAVLTFHLVEEPIRHAETLAKDVAAPLGIGLLATTAACVIGMMMMTLAMRPPPVRSTNEVAATQKFYRKHALSGSQEVKFGAQILRLDPLNDAKGSPTKRAALIENVASALSFMGCPQGITDPGVKTCSVGETQNPSKTVLLLGDSHAQQWLPPIEQIALENGWEVRIYIKQFCLLMDGTLSVGTRRQGPTCVSWNEAVKKKVEAIRPSLIITSNYLTTADSIPATSMGQRRKFQTFSDLRIPTLVISDTPKPPDNVLECLEKNTTDYSKCAFNRTKAFESVGNSQRIATKNLQRVKLISLNSAICPTANCTATMGGVVVYRDDNHITNLFSLSLQDRLDKELRVFAPKLYRKSVETRHIQ